MVLSVLSALARQDVDPWTEAERLSQLPKDKAVTEMLAFLDAMPSRALESVDRMAVAARLCALLPRRTTSILAAKMRTPAWTSTALRTPPRTLARTPASGVDKAEGFSLNWRFVGIYICLMLLMNWLIAQYAAAPAAPSDPDSPPLVAAATPNSVDSAAGGTTHVAENSAAVR